MPPYIGDPVIGRIMEVQYDRYRNDGERDRDRAFIEQYNTSYVSWWPQGQASFTSKLAQERNLFLETDITCEGSRPHVVYTLSGLNMQAMQAEWLNIRSKPNAHYQLLRKSCSTVVMRVLKAGGALNKLPMAKRAWFANNLYITPKNIAQVCNELRDAGYASKAKSANCPEKGAFMFGLR
ncbi:MAG: Multifunctional-autoprocessing repeats-in-toxin [Pseudomonas fluorescens]|nr:MAG: Multifunctional-autoprocessing repeats-in-toxin [Pseudomonas fluorescens]